MNLTNQVKLLRCLIAYGVLDRAGIDTYVGRRVRNKLKTREYRITATTIKDSGGAITDIDWTFQSRDTGEAPKRRRPRPGAIRS